MIKKASSMNHLYFICPHIYTYRFWVMIKVKYSHKHKILDQNLFPLEIVAKADQYYNNNKNYAKNPK